MHARANSIGSPEAFGTRSLERVQAKDIIAERNDLSTMIERVVESARKISGPLKKFFIIVRVVTYI